MIIKMVKTQKILILGGGLTGLSTALKLIDQNKDLDITLLEKKPYFGGLAGSFNQDSYDIPIYYHHIIESNKATIRYLKRYNLLADCNWKPIKMALANKGKLFNINSINGLLTYNGLSLWGKFRFGLFGLYVLFFLNLNKINKKLDAKTWLIKYAGKEVTKNIFHNLYARNKFNIPLSKISANQFANRLKEKEIYDKFTYPKKGLNNLINNMVSDLKTFNVKLLNSVNITAIDLKKKEVIFKHKSKANKINYDYIINTIPVQEFIKISKNFPIQYKQNLLKLKYCPAVSITFGTDKFMDKKHYWINFFNEQPHIIMQHSILNDAYPWKVNWILRYGGSEEDLDKSDDQIKTEYFKVVKKYFPHVKICWAKVFKEKYGEPIYDKDYSTYQPTYITPVDSLFMAGIQVTYPRIRNMNVALESGEKVANIILKRINQ